MTTTSSSKTRTITLTGRPPVKVKEDDWPFVASASYHEYDGQYDFQASTHSRGLLKVREHADGRIIVYATASYDTAFQNESGWNRKAGELLPADCDQPAMIAAIRRVHATMMASMPSDTELYAPLVDECIADLPAEEI